MLKYRTFISPFVLLLPVPLIIAALNAEVSHAQTPPAASAPSASIPDEDDIVGTPFNVQIPPTPPTMPGEQIVNVPQGAQPIPPSAVFSPPAIPNQAIPAPAASMMAPNSAAPTQPKSNSVSQVIAYDPKPDAKTVLVVKTSEGEFKISLKNSLAPRNVENFVQLALGQKDFVDVRTSKKVKRPFYTGLTCHRVIKSVLIQCGCPVGNGTGGTGETVLDERSPSARFDRPGVVAMALSRKTNTNGLEYEPNSASSQFFISLGPLPEYNEQFTIIGHVVSGMETIRKIAKTPTGPTDRPLKRVIIFSVDPENAPSTEVSTSPNTSFEAPAQPVTAPFVPPPNEHIDPFAAPPPMAPPPPARP